MRAGADLLSGVYHWGVDNYGDGGTPIFGSQIAGFQVSPSMQANKLRSLSDADRKPVMRRSLTSSARMTVFRRRITSGRGQ